MGVGWRGVEVGCYFEFFFLLILASSFWTKTIYNNKTRQKIVACSFDGKNLFGAFGLRKRKIIYPPRTVRLLIVKIGLGHPNKMFRFPSPSTRKVGSVGRIKKKSKNNFKVIQFL